MACYHPIKGYRSLTVGKNGKRPIVFDKRKGFIDCPIYVPCGQCIGCRLEYSRQWAMRCYHESTLHDSNCFVTLTFDDEHLPENNSVDVRDVQLFLKRLRKKFGEGVRVFYCGEYGELNFRPHYHALLFNFDFPDREYFVTKNNFRLDTSDSLQSLWPFGFCTVGDVTFESAAYVARYIVKKINGSDAWRNYTDFDMNTGEVYERNKEFANSSRGSKKLGTGGIGKGWFEKFKNDAYPSDFITVRGVKMKPPKYYDGQLEVINPEEIKDIKRRRIAGAKLFEENNTPDRLKVREKVHLARSSLLRRNLEKET